MPKLHVETVANLPGDKPELNLSDFLIPRFSRALFFVLSHAGYVCPLLWV